MVDAVFPEELERIVGGISFEDSNCAFGKRQTQTVHLRVLNLDLISSLQVHLVGTASVDFDEVVFSDLNIVDFRNKFHLLL